MNLQKLFRAVTNEKPEFRPHFLDLDAICLTAIDSLPVVYGKESTAGSSFWKNELSDQYPILKRK